MRALVVADARFVVIGGVALQFHGSTYTTFDLDIAYERTRDNAARIASALAPFQPRPREFAQELPFVFDAQAILSSEILTLETTAGAVDLLGAVKGIGGFEDVLALADAIDFEGFALRVLGIDGLIRSKSAAARPKDEPGLVELEALREARNVADGDTDGGD